MRYTQILCRDIYVYIHIHIHIHACIHTGAIDADEAWKGLADFARENVKKEKERNDDDDPLGVELSSLEVCMYVYLCVCVCMYSCVCARVFVCLHIRKKN